MIVNIPDWVMTILWIGFCLTPIEEVPKACKALIKILRRRRKLKDVTITLKIEGRFPPYVLRPLAFEPGLPPDGNWVFVHPNVVWRWNPTRGEWEVWK